jgi:hypothetical protein
MRVNQLATLFLRLMGVYVLIEAIPAVATSWAGIQSVLNSGDNFPLFGIFVPLIARIIIGILLMAFSGLWGQKIASNDSDNEKMSSITFEQAQSLAFAVIGIFIFADGLPQLGNSISYLMMFLSSSSSWSGYSRTPFGGTFQFGIAGGPILKVLLGLWLFFGAKGFAHFWSSTQNFNPPEPPKVP